MCRASGLGTLVYSWERRFGRRWTTISDDNTASYTTDTTLTIGEYMYRCSVSNEAGSVVSNSATVNVYGECYTYRQDMMTQVSTGPPTSLCYRSPCSGSYKQFTLLID